MKKSAILSFAALAVLSLPAFGDDLPITAEQQKALTPDAVHTNLMEGNERYVAGEQSVRGIKAAAGGQFPQAVILSCLDSRVPVEDVFDQGIGDIFVGRVAGNVENVDQLGSMEFAAGAAGVKLVMVLGHEACGAVKGACDNVELGNLTRLLEKIKPAINSVEGYEESERNSRNTEFVNKVIEANVRQTVADIRKRSEVLAGMEKEGKIKIAGATCSLQDGSVTLLD
ncbi:MAG: carbonic anhydrase family protein [Verrucomicrobiales bacterium]|nr:carbonic anhydrase family protein [Verrucomicrobiales bacterium]